MLCCPCRYDLSLKMCCKRSLVQTQHQRSSSSSGWKLKQVGGLFGAGSSRALVMEASAAMAAGAPVAMDYGPDKSGGCLDRLLACCLAYWHHSWREHWAANSRQLVACLSAPQHQGAPMPRRADGQVLLDRGVLDPIVNQVRPAIEQQRLQPPGQCTLLPLSFRSFPRCSPAMR